MIKSKSILAEHIERIDICKTKEDLFNVLSNVREILINNRSFSFFISKNKIVTNKIKQIYYYNNSVKESVYRILNKIDYDVICQCGNKVKFIDNNRGYNTFCSDDKCKYLNEKRKKSIKETFDKKYGGHPMKTDVTKKRLKESVYNKYGYDNIMKYYSINNMIKSPFRLDSTKNKIKKTFNLKYGGHPMQSDESFERNLKSRVKFKNYILPSGKNIKLQGYELFAIEYLLNKYNEDNIIYDVSGINKEIGFIYYEHNGKSRKYYPDFYIRSENKIYEVKSIWTYKANIEKNILKRRTCEDKGIKFEFLIFDHKGNIINNY